MEDPTILLTPEEMKERIEEIRDYETVLSHLGNDLWAEKTKLQDEYRKVTGKEI